MTDAPASLPDQLADAEAGLADRLRTVADGDVRVSARDGLMGIHPDQSELHGWADLMEAAADALDAAIRERDEARSYGKEVGAALVGLTCDGSEFYRRGGVDWRVDPAACVAYVRRLRADKHESVLRFARRANEAEAQLSAALARAERAEKALDFYRSAAVTSCTMDGLHYQGVSNSMFRHAWEADRTALAPPATAEET
jgi:hypothetical protein